MFCRCEIVAKSDVRDICCFGGETGVHWEFSGLGEEGTMYFCCFGDIILLGGNWELSVFFE